MAALPWWSKVQAHIGARQTTYGELASRSGLPERTLRRWVRRGPDADPTQGPAGELDFVRRLAQALGWPIWYLIDGDWGYPPPPPFLRLAERVAQLSSERRELLVRAIATDVADALIPVLDRYEDVRESIHRHLRDAADGEQP